MNNSHANALRSYARDLQWLLALRLAVQLVTAWLFFWGVVVLALRIFGFQSALLLAPGFIVIFPLIGVAVWQARRQKPAFAKLQASYDRLNACGGLIMAGETGDMDEWLDRLPAATIPKFHWRSGRPMLLLVVAALFVATTLLLPERLTHLANHRSLEIGQIVEQLKAEVQTLAQEKIVDDKKSEDVLHQLAQLQKDASGYDPSKTWEALDHIKQANTEAAKQAAEEAIAKTEQMTEAETLAKAMESAADSGMSEATAAQAAQDLASLLSSAKLEQGILNGKIPPELMAGLNGLNKEQMEQLAKALELNKGIMNSAVSNLANLKMIDAATLAKCNSAGHNPDFAGLAQYLSECKDGKCDSDMLFSWLQKRGRGGRGGGGPEAPMDWDNNTSEDNQKFQEHALPPAAHLSDAQTVGLSKAAPELAGDDAGVEYGALDGAAAGGGSAHAQVILPEHRQAVQKFFKREQ